MKNYVVTYYYPKYNKGCVLVDANNKTEAKYKVESFLIANEMNLIGKTDVVRGSIPMRFGETMSIIVDIRNNY